jgi:AcrR family transcriptional regulator
MPPPRQRMPGAERREQLLDSLLHVFATEGAHAVSIDRVAREAGAARTVVYAQFDSLDAMIDALVARSERRAVQRVAGLIPAAAIRNTSLSGVDVDQLLVDALRGLFSELANDPDMWRMIFMAPEGLPPAFASRLESGRELVVRMLQPVVTRGLRSHGLDALDGEIAARMLQALIREGARLHLRDPETYPVDRVIGQLEALMAALGAR